MVTVARCARLSRTHVASTGDSTTPDDSTPSHNYIHRQHSR